MSKNIILHLAILCAGALFGFYFTLSVSIMPGFDLSDPYAALQANQAIGRATQKSAFFVALLGTPLLLSVTLAGTWAHSATRLWLCTALAAWVGMMAVTLLCNVPLNQRLDGMDISANAEGLTKAWQAYSQPWQFWNWFRLAFSGVTLWAGVVAMRSMHCHSNSAARQEN